MNEWLYFGKPLHMNHIKTACESTWREENLDRIKKENLKVMIEGTVIGVRKECVEEILKTNLDVKNARYGMALMPHERREKFIIKSEQDLYLLLAYYVELVSE